MEGRGVIADEDERGRSVRERTEAEDLDCGLEEVSGASSKVSCPTGKHCGVTIRGGHLLLPCPSSRHSRVSSPFRPWCLVSATDRM